MKVGTGVAVLALAVVGFALVPAASAAVPQSDTCNGYIEDDGCWIGGQYCRLYVTFLGCVRG